jgi:hypothetical protein
MTNVLRMQEVLPAGSVPVPPTADSGLGSGRVLRVKIVGRPEQVATVVMASTLQTYRVYLPETDEYVDAEIEWVATASEKATS